MSRKRRLKTILFSDIAGYSYIMSTDEELAMRILERFKTTIYEEIEKLDGKIWNFYGDGCLATFSSTSQAIDFALAVQKRFFLEPVVKARIGIHLGEVLQTKDNIHGDAVNISSRIESMGIPHSILISKAVFNQIQNKEQYKVELIGKFLFKNIPEKMEVFGLVAPNLVLPDKEEVEGKFEKPRRTSNKIKVLVSIIIGIIALTSYWFLLPSELKATNKRSNYLAVLPISPINKTDSYSELCASITRAIYLNLSHLKNIKLVSVHKMGDELGKVDLTRIFKEYDLNFIVAGDAQFNIKELNDITGDIQVELLDKEHSSPLLVEGGIIDFKGNYFKTVNSIARKIVEKMKIKISEEEEILSTAYPTEDPQAFLLYSKAHVFSKNRDRASLEIAITFLEEAINRDSSFALAYAEMSSIEFAIGWIDRKSFRDQALEAEKLARHAIKLNPNVFVAHSILATIEELVNKNYDKAEELYIKAININPNDASAMRYYSLFLKRSQRLDEALDLAFRSYELTPDNLGTNRNYVDILIFSEDYFQALLFLEEFQVRFPEESLSYQGYMGEIYARKGEIKKALEFYLMGLSEKPSLAAEIGYCYGIMGDMEKARDMMSKIPDSFYSDLNKGLVYIGMAKNDFAYQDSAKYFVRKSIGQNIGNNFICNHPFFAEYRESFCEEN